MKTLKQKEMPRRASVSTGSLCVTAFFVLAAVLAQGCDDTTGSRNRPDAESEVMGRDAEILGDKEPAIEQEQSGDVMDADGLEPADQGELVSESGDLSEEMEVSGECGPLPEPDGNVVRVLPDQADRLASIVADAETGTTILLEDGLYDMSGGDSDYRLNFRTPGVTLRSASGDREAVILDGGYTTQEIISISASNITIADLTIKRAYNHPIHVTGAPDRDIQGTLIYNVHIIDPGEQGIKINASSQDHYADKGRIECSLIEMTDQGRPHVRNNCYTGGIDAHLAWGWVIRLNTIKGFWCDSGLSEHAVHFWRMCRDTLVERNIIINCARGIGFGLARESGGRDRAYPDNPYPGVGYMDHIDGIIRNNFVFADIPGYDSGISLWQAHGAQVYHNTVIGPAQGFSSIEWRFDHTTAKIKNNLANLPLRERDGAYAEQAGNKVHATESDFVDMQKADLHLVPGSAAVDAGVELEPGLCDQDIDGQPRTGKRDIGADEI